MKQTKPVGNVHSTSIVCTLCCRKLSNIVTLQYSTESQNITTY